LLRQQSAIALQDLTLQASPWFTKGIDHGYRTTRSLEMVPDPSTLAGDPPEKISLPKSRVVILQICAIVIDV
jgi:hypothetical protein